MTDGSDLLQIRDELELQDLQRLIAGQICILVVKKYISVKCLKSLQKFVFSEPTSPYTHEVTEPKGITHLYYGVDRIGFPFNLTFGTSQQSQAKEQYYKAALPTIRAIRNSCLPYLTPIDRLRMELDEIWPKGANIATFEGKKMFVGIFRLMNPELSSGSENPHFDALPKHVFKLDGQFAANMFISVPEIGGETEVWNLPPMSPTENLDVQDGPWRDTVPKPISYKPEVADLVIFSSLRPHAIRRFAAGHRISLQCFIGSLDDSSLVLWN